MELQRVGLNNNNKKYSLTSYNCADVLPNSLGSFLQSLFEPVLWDFLWL